MKVCTINVDNGRRHYRRIQDLRNRVPTAKDQSFDKKWVNMGPRKLERKMTILWGPETQLRRIPTHFTTANG